MLLIADRSPMSFSSSGVFALSCWFAARADAFAPCRRVALDCVRYNGLGALYWER